MFDEAFRSFGLPDAGLGRWGTSMAQFDWLKPSLDVGATEKEYSVSVELPGVDAKDVRLELNGDTLKIKGEKNQEKEEKDKNYYRVERSYGSFQRILSLPEDADSDGIKASYKNGIMNVTIPRRALPDAGTRQIEIASEE
jgi:HSP20 family protein